jgi:predicted transcriptional regulator
MFMAKPITKKSFKDYSEFRVILLKNNINDLGSLAKFLGLGISAVSERFSKKQNWKLKDLLRMSKKFSITVDEIVSMLDIKA